MNGEQLKSKNLTSNINLWHNIESMFTHLKSIDSTEDSKPPAEPTEVTKRSADIPEDTNSIHVHTKEYIPSAALPVEEPLSPVARGRKSPVTPLKKLQNQRRNIASRIMKRIKDCLKLYEEMLSQEGWFQPSNMKDDMPDTPSYSMMHALKDDYEIVMWSYTHNHKLVKSFLVHCNSSI